MRLRVLFTTVGLSCCSISPLYAFEVGVKTGLDTHTVNSTTSANHSSAIVGSSTTFSGGITTEFPLTTALAVEVNMLWIPRGAPLRYALEELDAVLVGDTLLQTLSFPILLKLSWPSGWIRPYGVGGAEFFYVATTSIAFGNGLQAKLRNPGRTGFGGIVGGGAEFIFERPTGSSWGISTDLRLVFSRASLDIGDQTNLRNTQIFLGLWLEI